MAGAHGHRARRGRSIPVGNSGVTQTARSVRRGRIPPRLLGGIFPAVAGRQRAVVGLGAFIAVAEGNGGKVEVASARTGQFSPARARKAGPSAALERAAKRLCRGDVGPLARVLDAFGSAHRLRMLTCLLEGPATYRMLQRRTNLQAGPLYHHVNQLRLAGLVTPKARDTYSLTRAGRNAVLVMMTLGPLLKDTSSRSVEFGAGSRARGQKKL